jgi:predicted permease
MRLHGWLLKLYPRSFRNEYGEELRRVFERQRRDASGPAAAVALWIGEIVDVVANAGRVHLDILRQDVRYSMRSLRRTPGFFLAAVTVTALGIGATTASFTLTDHILFRPLPFPDANPPRPVGSYGIGGTNDVSPANYSDWQKLSSSFEAMGAYSFTTANLVGTGEPERLAGVSVTPGVIQAIGVPPAAGRMLTDADDVPGAQCSVLVSEAFRRRKFPENASIVGAQILLDDEPCTIAGVMPPGFIFPTRDTAFWRPIRFTPAQREQRDNNYLRVVARIKSGVTLHQAHADLERVSAQLEKQYPENKDVSTALIPLRDEVGPQTRTMIYAVVGASVCLLLIACTNLASLFLARATARGRELSVRTALGAGSERLLRQLLTDATVIALAGAGLGVAIAIGAVPLAARLVPTTLPVDDVPAADWRMLLVAAAATLLTVVACGVAPAIRAARQASAGGLRDGARTGSSRRTERLRGVLVVAQVAASVALLVCTGLLLRALWRVQATDVGFNTGNVLTMRLNLPLPQYNAYATRAVFHRRVLEEVEALSNVKAAAFTSYLPLTMRGGSWPVFLPGQPQVPNGHMQMSLVRFVTPKYFDVMGITLLHGRRFDERDSLQGELVAIVSRTFGNKLWPGASPLGQRFVMNRIELTVVGVVEEIRVRGLERQNEPQVYMAATQHPDDAYGNYVARDLAVKTTRELGGTEMGALTASIRSTVGRADPRLPVSDVRPLAAIVENETAFRSVQAEVLRAFAIVAIVLAAVGLHGLLSFMVSARTREIGVRIALGAARGDILSMVLGRGLKLALVGGGVGLGAGYLVGTSFRAVLAGIDPADVAALGGALAVALTMTIGGSLFPALRASRTDPMTATRAE